MNTYARIYGGLVAELFSTDGDMATMFHPDLIWVNIDDMSPAPIVGWVAELVDGTWALKEPVAPIPTVDELKVSAMEQRDLLLSLADSATIGLGDAFITGILDEIDTTFFKEYAAYKLALVNIEKQTGYPESIKWPVAPTKV